MPIVTFNMLSDHIAGMKSDDWPAVTLICGEELLCKKAYKSVLDILLPKDEKALGVELFDGSDSRINAALTSMNTYALLASSKVVVFQDARLFYSIKARNELRDKMEKAGQNGEFKQASRPLLNLMGLYGLTLEDLATPSLRNKITKDPDGKPAPWFSQLIDYCREKGLTVPDSHDDSDLLRSAMKKGFPVGHRLVITTDIVDKKKALFKTIEETGLVVDCIVPKGATRSDRMAQEAVSMATMEDLLSKAGKKIAVDGRRRLMEWTGFDLRTLSDNTEKLISYVGNRPTITDADVTKVLKRTRKDPIFDFTNAVADRNLIAVLPLMNRLLDDELHPLQLLAAVANQVRRLLVAKAFIVQDRGRTWSRGMSFPQFKSAPFKAVLTADEHYTSLSASLNADTSPSVKGKKKKKPPAGDLLLAKNPKSPFPVYQTLKKADNFSQKELVSALIELSDIDLKMKSTGQAPNLLLEKFLIQLCRK